MSAPKRIPAFQFYPHAWLSSMSVTMMTAETEGTYIRLLSQLWVGLTQGDGRLLPSDPRQIRTLTKLSESQWKKAWPQLEEHFPLNDERTGRTNPTLHALWLGLLDFREKQRENGITGGRPKNPPQQKEKPKRNPEITQAFPDQNPNESSVSVSVTETPKELSDDSSKAPSGQPPTPAVVYDAEYQQLLDAGLPHERYALQVLVARHPYPASLVLELAAIACGMHVIRGSHTGREADVADVMRAVAELAANGAEFSTKLFRGYVRRIADRAPEPASTEAREAARLQREIAAQAERAKLTLVDDTPDTPEAKAERAKARANAMAKWREEFRSHNPETPVERLNPADVLGAA